jgi:CubicO group peptidase (beta-lactamase class C family)
VAPLPPARLVRPDNPTAARDRYRPNVTLLDRVVGRLDAELDRWQVPGLELAVVQGDDVLVTRGAGLRDAARGLPVTPSTLFHHGSTGKAFTAVLAAMLVDEGLLAWDRPVRETLPEFRLYDPVLTERVTLIDLLSHRSGLARHDMSWVLNPRWPADELLRRLRYLQPANDLRAAFGYCNYGYVAVGELIARVTGSGWDEQLRKRVLDPLGMTRTVASVTAAESSDDHALPYAVRDDGPVELAYRRSDPTAAAGGVISCAVDAAHWLRFQSAGGVLDGQRLVSEHGIAQTRSVHIPLEAQLRPDPEVRYDGYATGWLVGSYRGEPMIWHNGGIDGFYTEITVLPERKAGVLVSVNAHMSMLATAVLYESLDALLGIGDGKWFDRKFEHWQASGSATMEGESRQRVVPGTRPAHPPAEYAGRYEHPGYGVIAVSAGPGTDLQVQVGEVPMVARHRHFDVWQFRHEQLDEQFPIRFVTDDDGFVAEAVVPFEPTTAPIRFRRVPDAALSDPGLRARSAVEPPVGIEPTTCSLRVPPAASTSVQVTGG